MKQYKMIQPKEYVEIANIKPGMLTALPARPSLNCI
jgi:hypothetical protein